MNDYNIGVLSKHEDAPLSIGTGFNNVVSHIVRWRDYLYCFGYFTEYNGTAISYIARLYMDGTLDTTFAPVTLNQVVYHGDVDSSGNVYFTGAFTTVDGVSSPYIGSVTSTGARNTAFSVGTGFNTQSYSGLQITPNDVIYVNGNFTTYKGSSYNRVIGLNPDGSVNTTFNVGTALNNNTYVGVLAGNDYIVGGLFTTYQGSSKTYLVRINPDGSADTGYGGTMNGRVYSAAYDRFYNNTYAVSYSSTGIKRIAADGSIDTAFTGKPIGGYPESLLCIDNNRVLLLSNGTTYNAVTRNRIVCIAADGNIDTSFYYNGGFNASTGLYGSVYYYNPTTKSAYIGGNATSYNGTAKNRLFKIKVETGNLDMI